MIIHKNYLAYRSNIEIPSEITDKERETPNLLQICNTLPHEFS